MSRKTYSELMMIDSFDDRFDYLKLRSSVGEQTFGFERYLNQDFYRSYEWKHVRQVIIARDLGCDLAVEGYEIYDRIIIHHMNPMSIDDIEDGNPDILNPEYLITTTHRTHNAIHYGDKSLLIPPLVERRPGDTILWKRQ